MATLREAEQARDETAEALRRLGAHAISVEEETEALDAELGAIAVEPTAAGRAAQPGGGAVQPTVAGGGAAESTVPGGAISSSGAGTDVGARTGAGTVEQSGAGPADDESPADLPVGAEPVADQAAGDALRPQKRRSFAVVAWFEGDPPVDLPRDLEIQAGTRTKVVPLRARRTERFRAE
jgi:hypothetical protein